jgi:hypothetical protein
MQLRSFRFASVLMTGLLTLLLLNAAVVPTCRAGETGTLKLKVRPCYSTNWLSGAAVDVVIYRPGIGNVDSASESTDSAGYVEFTFYDLSGGDQARVTITPVDLDPDSSHTYYWIPGRGRAPGYWDVGVSGMSVCQDGWYDETNNVILCLYQ